MSKTPTPDGGRPDPDNKPDSVQSQGGKARADSLSPAQRTAIARRAAIARWGSDLPYATHDGILPLADRKIQCAVLNTRVRVLTQESFLTSMGRAGKAKGGTGVLTSSERVDDLPPFLAAENLKDFIDDALRESTTPVLFRSKNGIVVLGFDARLLPKVCDVYIRAGLARKLTRKQMEIAEACRRLNQGFAEVGIVALVDDATGYAEDRARDELAKILEAYIAPELAPWTQKFPHEFFRQIYRLHGWNYRPGVTRGPRYIGKFIMKYVWGGLPKDVVDRIKQLNPTNEKGQRPKKLFQFLTGETGIPHLDWQISTVTTLMRGSRDRGQFTEIYGRAFQKPTQMMLTFEDKPDDDISGATVSA